MSLSPAVLDALLEAGCTREQIVAAVKADMAEAEAAKDDKRAKDAERQRRHRARNDPSRDVTVTNGDSVTSPLPRPLSPQTPQTPTPTPETKTRARKGHRLPEDWEPEPLTGDTAKAVAVWPAGERRCHAVTVCHCDIA